MMRHNTYLAWIVFFLLAVPTAVSADESCTGDAGFETCEGTPSEIGDVLQYALPIAALGVNPVEQRWFDAMKRTGYERLDQVTEATLAPIKGTVLKQKTVTKSRDVRKNRERIKVDEIDMTSFVRVDSAEISDDLFRVEGCRQVSDKKMKDAVKDMFKSVVKP